MLVICGDYVPRKKGAGFLFPYHTFSSEIWIRRINDAADHSDRNADLQAQLDDLKEKVADLGKKRRALVRIH